MRFKRAGLIYFTAGAAAALALVSAPASAVVSALTADAHPSSFDGTPPTLTMKPTQFVTGASIDAAGPIVDLCTYYSWNMTVPLTMNWSASDATSGIDAFDVWNTTNTPTQKVVADTSATSYRFSGSNYRNDCGGGIHPTRYFVIAKDNRGNVATSNLGATQELDVWQETGVAPFGASATLPLTKSGTWFTASCTCFNNGKTLYSTAVGASLSYKVTTQEPGQTFALVMEKNTNRGAVNISVDGGTASTVDTYASTATHRVIVWQKTLTPGTHNVKVANAGTTGRTRVDVDALMMTHQPTDPAPAITAFE